MKAILLTCLVVFISMASEEKILQVYQLFNVKTTTVQEETIEITHDLYGKAVVDERSVTLITPRFDGYIEKLHANTTYQTVAQGEKLFDYYSPEVLAAQVELVNALGFQNRTKLQSSAEEKLRLYGIPEATIQEIKKKRASSPVLTYRSPVQGVIMEKSLFEGGAFKKGQTIYQIADLSRIWVEVEVYQELRETIQPGMPARIRFKGLEKGFTGKVIQDHPIINPQSQTYVARIDIRNPQLEIIPGMFANVSVINAQKTVRVLPKTAVIEKGDRHIVFIAGEFEGEYEPATIQAKRLPNGKYQILSGLETGTKVVDNALFMMDSDAQMNGMY